MRGCERRGMRAFDQRSSERGANMFERVMMVVVAVLKGLRYMLEMW